jgi:hypothetical protein
VRIEEKRALVARFFDASTPNEWRAQLLRDEHITYVFAGPDDNFSPGSTNSLLSVYQIEGYTVYKVASER